MKVRVAGRVVRVMFLIAFRLPWAGPLTTTMEHRGGQDHDNAPSSWLCWAGAGRRWFGTRQRLVPVVRELQVGRADLHVRPPDRVAAVDSAEKSYTNGAWSEGLEEPWVN
jgi:hypothetical protein